VLQIHAAWTSLGATCLHGICANVVDSSGRPGDPRPALDGLRRKVLLDRAVALDRSLLLQWPADLISGAYALVEAWRGKAGPRRIDVTPMSEAWLKQLEASRGKRDTY
jgi:hypothetical protein